jgi:phenylacetic acid degradation operon negative regulatory protein
MQLTAKNLILGLLLASDARALSASGIIAACELFGITDNSGRVALTRLAADGKIESAGRGAYRLGRAARRVSDEVAAWRQSEARLVPWRGDFLVAFTANLGRRDRAQLRHRERALEMLGFRELERGLHVRPNNIGPDLCAVRSRLVGLGLEVECPVFSAASFDAADRRRIDALWDGAALGSLYVDETARLEAWMHRHGRLDPDVAARESYLLGREAIRSVVFDPWLPAPLVDVDARHAFFETVCRFDDLGKSIWSRFAADLSAQPPRQAEPAPLHH